jgi:triosephosphate isomerase (TIM)
MSRKKIVAGNWKMNKTWEEAQSLVNELLPLIASFTAVEKVIIPAFPYLSGISSQIGAAPLHLGAQDCSAQDLGAYTGEVSAKMLSSLNCKYVLVGHSERRTYHHESTALLIGKLKQVLTNGLTPIFCIGETLNERKSGNQEETVGAQVIDVLNGIDKREVSKMIIAYEPVWAIGTGETATPGQAQEMHAFIRQLVKTNYGKEIADNMSILYGGSCNAQNARELFSCADIDGGLIGGASLKAEDFSKIIASF